MKILHMEQPWPSKTNFVDENEVHLGYDATDDCCATGGWFLADDAEWVPKADSGSEWPEAYEMRSMDLPGWSFDVHYFRERTICGEGGAVQFRIVKGSEQQFLTLYNHQNGYYSRGFELAVKGKQNREGQI